MADARSGGGPKAYGPASCIAPYPDRLTSIWPSSNVDIMPASRLEPAPRAWRNDDIGISRVMSTLDGQIALRIHRSARPWFREITGTRSEEHTSELQSLRHLVC